MSIRSRWSTVPRGVRAATIGIAVLVVFSVSVTFFDRATRGRAPTSVESRGSSRSTATNGTLAYRELLAGYGHHVVLLPNLHITRDARTTTLLILDAQFPSGRDRAAVQDFARAGGRVVVAGFEADSWDRSLQHTQASSRRETVTIDGARFRVLTAHTTRWDTPSGPRLVVTRRVGAGVFLTVADESPLTNAGLGHADNAAFGLALAGPRQRVAFAEGFHGLSADTGWAAVPTGWKVAILGGALALLLTAVVRGRRFAGPEATSRALDPARRVTADDLAVALARARRPDTALDDLRVATRARVAANAGLAPDTPDADVVAAAIGAGWDPADAAALIARPHDRTTTLALGRAVARSHQGAP